MYTYSYIIQYCSLYYTVSNICIYIHNHIWLNGKVQPDAIGHIPGSCYGFLCYNLLTMYQNTTCYTNAFVSYCPESSRSYL